MCQIERYVKDSLNVEMAQLQQSAVHNHTAAILDLGTNLLTQTAQHTRKLTDVEIQVQYESYTNIPLQRTFKCMLWYQ